MQAEHSDNLVFQQLSITRGVWWRDQDLAADWLTQRNGNLLRKGRCGDEKRRWATADIKE
eukprot:6187245-Pleurochrysis_carterae.AAC.4